MDATLAYATQLKEILDVLLSPDNTTRQQGEAALEAAQSQERAGPFVLALLALCGDWCLPELARPDGASAVGAAAPTRALAAVLLRRRLDDMWPRVATPAREETILSRRHARHVARARSRTRAFELGARFDRSGGDRTIFAGRRGDEGDRAALARGGVRGGAARGGAGSREKGRRRGRRGRGGRRGGTRGAFKMHS